MKKEWRHRSLHNEALKRGESARHIDSVKCAALLKEVDSCNGMWLSEETIQDCSVSLQGLIASDLGLFLRRTLAAAAGAVYWQHGSWECLLVGSRLKCGQRVISRFMVCEHYKVHK